jgi:hypothetical protein
MKKYALIYTSNKLLVMEFADWMKYPIGCVMETSDDEIELCREANLRNLNLPASLFGSSVEG